MDVFSAHADKKDLLSYVRATKPDKLKNIFIVHGEPEESLPLRDAIRSSGYSKVEYPAPGEAFEI
jgi:metallo-beta-lactamase family protein